MYWHSGEIPSSASATVKSIIATGGSLAIDNDAGSVTLTDVQQNTVVLDSSGVTSTSGASTVAIGSSGVNVNDGALEVS
jgi:acid phosphatase family membrane protein YuiD